MPYDMNGGPTKGGRTQDDKQPMKKMYKGPKNSGMRMGGADYAKSSGAYNKSDTYHGMSKGGNTAEKAMKMYGRIK